VILSDSRTTVAFNALDVSGMYACKKSSMPSVTLTFYSRDELIVYQAPADKSVYDQIIEWAEEHNWEACAPPESACVKPVRSDT